ncbi:MAG: phosphoribosylaminoimidazolecarboxamide formyltransferase [Dehalococcoidia bacterium]
MTSDLTLRYGMNPHQTPARVFRDGPLPFRVVNGSPGTINLLDALNAWQLVRELKQVSGLPAATSFKHVSPAGAAIGIPLSEPLRTASFLGSLELTPLASAYARARGADRVSSYGDFAALSDRVDVPTAILLRRENSDGIIAPGYDPEALEILTAKKAGKYVVLEVDPEYQPPEIERRDVFGITFEQRHNDVVASPDQLTTIVTKNQDLPDEAKRDMLVALTALKYTQSNSVCLALDGQIIGMGAGQQSRIHCTRLAAGKADLWWLRQHPAVLRMQFRQGVSRPDRDNAVDAYLSDDLTPAEERVWQEHLAVIPKRLSVEDKRVWLDRLTGVTLGSDAYIPFRDNLDRASRSGVRYVVQPGGALRDESVIAAADGYGMVMVYSGVRLFHH